MHLLEPSNSNSEMNLPIFFTILLFLPNHFQSIFAATTPISYKTFITRSCSTTTYPSVCNKYLSSYAAKVKKNPLKLCNAALIVSLKAANNSSAIVSKFLKQRVISKRDTGIIKDCIYNIKDSMDEIKQSIKALERINNSANKRFQLASIKTYVSAAITDEDTCIDGLNESKVSAGVKNKIKGVILHFERITSNALSLINHLKF